MMPFFDGYERCKSIVAVFCGKTAAACAALMLFAGNRQIPMYGENTIRWL